ncbi:MAG: alpha,alpha-phosphotrehalase [Lachnospiraceae bacterium]|nr:alpha,alpha-phosphotrehalase [Lachnospiraceae bacterium]
MGTFKNHVIYQIYTKSFMDANGDGLGDLRGVCSRLDYLKELGVDDLWLTPFFKSPLRDNGYDISDYLAIDPVFGTMEDVEELIAQADQRGMGLMFDMVFNHTSTEHAWFQKALAGDPEYLDYYIFKDGAPDTPPTNWESKFGGSAWEYVPHLKKWYLHLFDVTQADLNWENPRVREELKNVIRFWKQKGIRGFRFDVINLISKPEQFESDRTGDGRRFYTDGPHIHEYLKELVHDTGIQDMITVGEMSSTTLNHCVRYSNPAERELSMVFSFHHLKVDYKDGKKWELKAPDYRQLKRLLSEWQLGMQEQNGWNALFWCNHDQPRIVSRLGDEHRYWKESAKMLGTAFHMLRGTPYIYQGEELGMTNPGYQTIGEYRDVESINYYKILLAEGKTEAEALQILGARSRDNGRTPMQWNAEDYAGFSNRKPWISIPDNHSSINAEAERADADSILNYYKKLISLRKQYPVIAEGTVGFLFEEQEETFCYQRETEEETLLVLNNFRDRKVTLPEALDISGYAYLAGNYGNTEGSAEVTALKPYETMVLYRTRNKMATD